MDKPLTLGVYAGIAFLKCIKIKPKKPNRLTPALPTTKQQARGLQLFW